MCSSEQTGLAPVVDAISASCSVWGTLGTSVADLGLLPRPFQVQGRVCDALWLPGGLQELPGKRLESQNLQAGIAEQGELDNEQNGYFGKCRGPHPSASGTGELLPCSQGIILEPQGQFQCPQHHGVARAAGRTATRRSIVKYVDKVGCGRLEERPPKPAAAGKSGKTHQEPRGQGRRADLVERAKQKEARANNKTKATVEAMVEHHGDSRPLSWKPWVFLCRMSRHRNPQ